MGSVHVELRPTQRASVRGLGFDSGIEAAKASASKAKSSCLR